MRNYVSSGHSVRAVAPSGGVTVNVPVLIGTNKFGVPLETAAAGSVFELQVMAEVRINKDTSVFAEGDTAYWDNTNKVATSTTSGNRKIGIVDVAAASGDAQAIVNLIPQLV